MIDTIAFEVIGTRDRYKFLKDHLKALTKEKEFTVVKFKDHTKDYTKKSVNGKIYIPSSSREINWHYNNLRNSVKFEFSIPKACFGTNIYQFLKHRNEGYDFNLTFASSVKWQLDHTYERLMNFIRMFLFLECQYTLVSENEYRKRISLNDDWQHKRYISMQDIEIDRIDICMNKIFKSAKNCNEYLDLLKSIHRKGMRQDKNKNREIYSSSIYIRGDYFTLKIYHKGFEFVTSEGREISDKNALIKINKELGYKKYDVDALEELANRMLRYEIEYKKPGLNRIYKSKLYKRKSEIYKVYKNQHDKYMLFEDKIERLKKLKEYPAKLSLYLIKLGYNSYSEAMKGLLDSLKPLEFGYKFYSRSQSQYADFCLEITDFEKHFQNYVDDEEIDEVKRTIESSALNSYRFQKNALISNNLVKEIGKHFLKFCDEFTLKEIPKDLYDSELIIKKFEKSVDVKLTFAFKRYLRLLDKMSMDEIKKSGEFPRATIYRFQRKLSEINILRNSRMKESIWVSPDFEEYQMEVQRDRFIGNLNCKYFKKLSIWD